MPARTRRQRSGIDIWPGFVDALSALLIIIIFLLMVFTLAQHFLSEALSGRDAALEELRRTVTELKETLNLRETENRQLETRISSLSGELQASISARDQLSSQLAELLPERDALAAMLKTRTTELKSMKARATDAEQRTRKLAAELEDAFKTVQADKEKIEAKLSEIASLMRDLAALRKVRADLEKKVVDLAKTLQVNKDELVELAKRYKAGQLELTALGDKYKETQKKLTEEKDKFKSSEAALGTLNIRFKQSQADLAKLKQDYGAAQSSMTALRDRSKELAASLSSEKERTALAQKKIQETEISLKKALANSGSLEGKLSQEKLITTSARKHVELLNRQIAALRQQLARLEAALDVSEKKSKDQKVQIVDLGRRLNLALASKVEELARYRSEFFGRLREVLGTRKDIRIVGDRFVFQSEVLFSSGSATLSEGGRQQIARLTRTLLQISKTIPKGLNWVLRVDGHTDILPIATTRFPSNWELSATRAIAVVKTMTGLGVAPNRLVAAGFGEFQPIDPREDEIGFRRNRRIEFKLTER